MVACSCARTSCEPPNGWQKMAAGSWSTKLLRISSLSRAWRRRCRRGPSSLRSFGKTYGLAGLRLGFALCDPALAEELRSALGPWAVSGPAIEIGARALADEGWRRSAAEDRAADARRLDACWRRPPRWSAARRSSCLVETRRRAGVVSTSSSGRYGIWVRRFEADAATAPPAWACPGDRGQPSRGIARLCG
jgi:aspartate/methionine/tyrosine aminotransferase